VLVGREEKVRDEEVRRKKRKIMKKARKEQCVKEIIKLINLINFKIMIS
jgi:hypothetical protein